MCQGYICKIDPQESNTDNSIRKDKRKYNVITLSFEQYQSTYKDWVSVGHKNDTDTQRLIYSSCNRIRENINNTFEKN